MSWENILKRPMPIDTASNRDEQYRQKIIQFEKDEIEPTLTQHLSSLPASSKPELTIMAGGYIDGMSSLYTNVYTISDDTIKNTLGGNPNFILDVIEELYKNEGYTTGRPNKHGSPTLKIYMK